MSYTSQIAVARSMIKRKGTACTWKSENTNVADDAPWKEVPSVLTDHAHYIVILPFSGRMFGYAPGTVVAAGTVMGLMAGSDAFTPTTRDAVLVGSTHYNVQKFDAINPDNVADILYILELRR